jgi:hypothetical protein
VGNNHDLITSDGSGVAKQGLDVRLRMARDRILITEPSLGSAWSAGYLGTSRIAVFADVARVAGTYHQTTLGMMSWVFLRPILNVLVLSLGS